MFFVGVALEQTDTWVHQSDMWNLAGKQRSIPQVPTHQWHCVITEVLSQGSMSWCESCQMMNLALRQAAMTMLEEVGKPQAIRRRQRSHGWRSLMVIFVMLKILGVGQLFNGGKWVQV
jgi:hypothetical protein